MHTTSARGALIGPAGHVKELVTAYAEAGVTTVSARPRATTHQRRVADIPTLNEIAS